jgi:hypothetical protein
MSASWFIKTSAGNQIGPFDEPSLKNYLINSENLAGWLVRQGDSPWASAEFVLAKFQDLEKNGIYLLYKGKSLGPFTQERANAILKENEGVSHFRKGDTSKWVPRDGKADCTEPILESTVEDTKPSQIETNPQSRASFGENASAAVKIMSLQAELTKLQNITIPFAFLALGREIANQRLGQELFPDLYEKLDSVKREITSLSETSDEPVSQRSLTDRAKAAGQQMADIARKKQMELKRESILRNIGESVYNQQSELTIPEHLAKPISEAFQRKEFIKTEIQRLSEIGKGGFLTPKRILVSTGVLFFFLLFSVGAKNQMERDANSSHSNISKTTSTNLGSKEGGFESSESTSDSPSREEMVNLVYLTAATIALSKPVGQGPSPEEFIELTHQAAISVVAGDNKHSRFLLTLVPDRDITKIVDGQKVRALYYGSEMAVFLPHRGTGRYVLLSCSIDGKQCISTNGQ